MTQQKAVDNEMYSASVVLKAIYVWSFEAQINGQAAYVIKLPERDLPVFMPSIAIDFSNFQQSQGQPNNYMNVLKGGR
jgi:hypothetical protein